MVVCNIGPKSDMDLWAVLSALPLYKERSVEAIKNKMVMMKPYLQAHGLESEDARDMATAVSDAVLDPAIITTFFERKKSGSRKRGGAASGGTSGTN